MVRQLEEALQPPAQALALHLALEQLVCRGLLARHPGLRRRLSVRARRLEHGQVDKAGGRGVLDDLAVEELRLLCERTQLWWRPGLIIGVRVGECRGNEWGRW